MAKRTPSASTELLTVRAGQRQVANDKGSLAGEISNRAVSRVALGDECGTFRHGFLHALVDGIIENLDAMRVVMSHFWIPLVL